MRNNKKAFCPACRRFTEYVLERKPVEKAINGKQYRFSLTVAVCRKCGRVLNVRGLIDRNVKEIDEQIREADGLVSMAEIETFAKLYRSGKVSVSPALGLGEKTIAKYLQGMMPSKDHSDSIREALATVANGEDVEALSPKTEKN